MDWPNPPSRRPEPYVGARNARLARIAIPDEFFGVCGYDTGADEPHFSDEEKALCAALARCVALELSRHLHVQRQELAQARTQQLLQTIRERDVVRPRPAEDVTQGLERGGDVELARAEDERAPCDLIELVRAVLTEQRAEAPAGTFVLVTTLPPGSLPVPVNPRLIRTVLKRLLANAQANALSFAPADGSIRVRVHRLGDEAWVSVVDLGHGLTHAEQEGTWNAISQRIPQDTPETASPTPDLGLAQCKTIIHRHGGQNGVGSLPDMGAHFWFRLPCLATS
jgi:signal transduction histidine kinase